MGSQTQTPIGYLPYPEPTSVQILEQRIFHGDLHLVEKKKALKAYGDGRETEKKPRGR